jgi:hypothetical protein
MTLITDTTDYNDFPYPTNDNDGTDFATGVEDLATAIDGMWRSGTIAARPAAGIVNRVYYATDTETLYVDNGSAWLVVALLVIPTSNPVSHSRTGLGVYQPNATRPTQCYISASYGVTVYVGSVNNEAYLVADCSIGEATSFYVPAGWYCSLSEGATVIEQTL